MTTSFSHTQNAVSLGDVCMIETFFMIFCMSQYITKRNACLNIVLTQRLFGVVNLHNDTHLSFYVSLIHLISHM